MDQLKHTWRKTPQSARRIIVLIIGGVFIIAGLAMLVLPGPGWATIFLGLAVMSSEFAWAERIRAGVVRRFKSALDSAKKATKR